MAVRKDLKLQADYKMKKVEARQFQNFICLFANQKFHTNTEKPQKFCKIWIVINAFNLTICKQPTERRGLGWRSAFQKNIIKNIKNNPQREEEDWDGMYFKRKS